MDKCFKESVTDICHLLMGNYYDSHLKKHTHTHTHPEGQQDRKLSGEIRVNILFILWDFNSKISLWRFKYIMSYPLKMQLIYSHLYSH